MPCGLLSSHNLCVLCQLMHELGRYRLAARLFSPRLAQPGYRGSEEGGLGDGGEDREAPVHHSARGARAAGRGDDGHACGGAGGVLQVSGVGFCRSFFPRRAALSSPLTL